LKQHNLYKTPSLQKVVRDWELSESDKGEIFTKPEIVDLMIAISGIPVSDSIANIKVLEPSCGQGEFLVPLVRQLLLLQEKAEVKIDLYSFSKMIVAYDIVEENVRITKNRLSDLLKEFNAPTQDIQFLISSWITRGDFLLADIAQNFSHVIGNPPYVRVENIPKQLLAKYREIFPTMSDRSDLYIPFFEKSLRLLRPNGKLCFICTDRWTKNQYGRRLREFIAESFSLDVFIDLYGANAFQTEVMTYPAITLISRTKNTRTVVCHQPDISSRLAEALNISMSQNEDNEKFGISIRKNVVQMHRPWLLGDVEKVRLIRKLEHQFPTLDEAGCNVFIGAATGNNKVFIVDESVDIEPSRRIPTISASEIKSGSLKEVGNYLVNTYDADGVVDLNNFPRLSAYLNKHKVDLEKRHIAKSTPKFWYKTIDRIYPERALREKLMIPDISSGFTVVYDEGKFHPNNSIYYICSQTWNLEALRLVLLSGIGDLFVHAYSTRIANGYKRFQAQHLRRIRIPHWNSISLKDQNDLIRAAKENDQVEARRLVKLIYCLDRTEENFLYE